jgi:hypothetical protein
VCIKKAPFNRIDKELPNGKISYTKCKKLKKIDIKDHEVEAITFQEN